MCRLPILTYGMNNIADVYPLGMHVVPGGYDLILSSPAGEIGFHSPLLGEFNVMNTVAVVSTLLALEFTPTGISEIMPRLQSVSGRMELVDHNRQGPQVRSEERRVGKEGRSRGAPEH